MLSCIFLLVLLSVLGASAQGQQGQRRCDPNGEVQCPTSGPYTTITTTSDANYTFIATTACPPYAIGWTNPNQACIQNANYTIPKTPRYANVPIPTGQRIRVYAGVHYLSANPAPILGAIGVLLNGVLAYGPAAICGGDHPCPTDDPNAPSRYVDVEAENRSGLDQCGGHASGQRQYHVHTGITIENSTGRAACSLPTDTPGEHSVLLGYMFDGFPMYGQYSQGGHRPTQLDSCSGHTHMINGKMQYHYHMPNDFPWMIGCFKGCPIVSNNRNQLRFSTTNVTYGCPNGLATDPNPLYEDAINTTVTTPSSGVSLLGSIVLVIASTVLCYISV